MSADPRPIIAGDELAEKLRRERVDNIASGERAQEGGDG